MIRKVSQRGQYVFVGLIGLLYFIYLFYLSIASHQALKTQMNDLGNVDQALWYFSQGDFTMKQTNHYGAEAISRFGVHANFIFWIIGMAYAMVPHPYVLFFISTAACVASGFGLYGIARHYLGETWWAIIPALCFWLSPIVHDANLYDFHVITMTACFVIWMIWAFEQGKTKIGWILLFVVLLCQEDAVLIVVMYGIYQMIRRHEFGLQILAVSLGYAMIVFGLFVPWVTDGKGLLPSDTRYHWLGRNALTVMETITNSPMMIIAHLFSPDRLRLPMYFLVSGGIVGISAWPILLLALPQMLSGMMTDNNFHTRLTGTYYWIIVYAIVLIAVIHSASAQNKKRMRMKLAYLLFATVFFSLLWSRLPHSVFSSWDHFEKSQNLEAINKIGSVLPQDAFLCVQNNLGPHMSQRKRISIFRDPKCREADFQIYYLDYTFGPNTGFFPQNEGWFVIQKHLKPFVEDIEKKLGSDLWVSCKAGGKVYIFKNVESGYACPQGEEPPGSLKARYEKDLKEFWQNEKQASALRRSVLVRYVTMPMTWREFIPLVSTRTRAEQG